jgi:heme exporter protein D
MALLTIAWAFLRLYVWKLLLIGAAVLTVLAVMARLKHAGRLQERAEQAARTAEIKQKQLEASKKAPKSLDALDKRLREGGVL